MPAFDVRSFAPDFFFSGEDGEPYDGLGDTERPSSVWAAIHAMPADEWRALARDVFGREPDSLLPEDVLNKVLETDTCESLSSPVPVRIDPDGAYMLRVYDRERGG